jgi:arylsulfatase A
MLGALLGEKDARGREHLVQQDNGASGSYGFRVGPWKLHRYDKRTARNVTVQAELANTQVPRYQLFHLGRDPGEQTDVLADNPEVAQRLQQQLARILESGRSRQP